MHNALSNSTMRNLKLICAFHISPQSTIWIFPLKIVKVQFIIYSPCCPLALLLLWFHRAAVSRQVPRIHPSPSSSGELSQPVALQEQIKNNFLFTLTQSISPLSQTLLEPHMCSRVVVGVIFCAPPARLIKYWNSLEWLHQIFSKSVVLDTELLGAPRW